MQDTAERGVREAIDRFRTAIHNRDIDALAEVVAQEDTTVFYGSQADDKQAGWDNIRRSFEEQFQEADRIQTQVRDSTVSASEDLAWAAYDLHYSEGNGSGAGDFDSRWTCVLRRYGNHWKFVHMHHSVGR